MREGHTRCGCQDERTLDGLAPAHRKRCRHELCSPGLGKKVLKGIREKLVKPIKKEESESPLW